VVFRRSTHDVGVTSLVSLVGSVCVVSKDGSSLPGWFSLSESRQDEGEKDQRLGEKTTSQKSERKRKKEDHPGTKLNFPARLPTSMSTSSEFHSQVRDGLAWFH
jgi:hypothetical protein